jgi:hypothetical protein
LRRVFALPLAAAAVLPRQLRFRWAERLIGIWAEETRGLAGDVVTARVVATSVVARAIIAALEARALWGSLTACGGGADSRGVESAIASAAEIRALMRLAGVAI